MASLIEELIMVLGEEERIYSEIIPLAEKKTRIIVKNDLQSLTSITERAGFSEQNQQTGKEKTGGHS